MHRELQREVNAGLLFENNVRISYYTNYHPPQIHAASDLDYCSLVILPWRKSVGPRIMRKSFRASEELMACCGQQHNRGEQLQKTPNFHDGTSRL